MTTETAMNPGSVSGPVPARGQRPVEILAGIAPVVVPALYQIAERTWPRKRESIRKRFGIVGPGERVRDELPPQYKIVLRSRDISTLKSCWRLEADGAVELFDWDDSGCINGAYGFRYPLYSICPVYDEVGIWVGFGLNGRVPSREDGALSAIDARLDCVAYIRSTDPTDLVTALKSLEGKPRVEEARPGLEPTSEYFQLLHRENKQLYLTNRGINQYVGPGWTPNTLQLAFKEHWVRAVWIADPKGPNATPAPQEH